MDGRADQGVGCLGAGRRTEETAPCPRPLSFTDGTRRVRAGDQAAAAELVRRYEPTIRRVLGAFYRPAPPYPTPLPPELAAWHCYTSDGGHAVLVVFPGDYQDGADLTDKLCPAPVKAVRRAGWQVRGGYVVCDLPYSPVLGLLTDPEDEEFAEETHP